MQTIKDVALERWLQFLTNSSLQYDSLIFLSAFSLAYFNNGKGTWAAVKYVVRKYVRYVSLGSLA